jgi:hypothetical protein
MSLARYTGYRVSHRGLGLSRGARPRARIEEDRFCECGEKLSVYNQGTTCYRHQKSVRRKENIRVQRRGR